MTPKDILSATYGSDCGSADGREHPRVSVRCSSLGEYSARLVREATKGVDDFTKTRLAKRVASLPVISMPFPPEETTLSPENLQHHDTYLRKVRSQENPQLEAYLSSCRTMKLTPATSLCRDLETGSAHISLRNRNLGCQGVKAMAQAFKDNDVVISIDLRGNAIGIQGARAVAEMLSNNTSITSLDLAENSIESTGLSVLLPAIQKHTTLTSADISDNQIGDKDGKVFSDIFRTCGHVTTLRISHNHIGDVTARYIAVALLASSVSELDLSWNHITHMGMSYLCRALQHNTTLSHLDMSWNGIGPQGCRDVARMLTCNDHLEWLDLSANRINLAGLVLLTRALARNTNLVCLKIASNLLTTAGAVSLVQCLADSPNTTLQELHLGSTAVDETFLDILETIETSGRHITVSHGPVVSTHSNSSSPLLLPSRDPVIHLDPMTQLFAFMRKRSLRVIDLFRTLDRNQNEVISRWEIKRAFERNVQKTLTVDGLMQLMKKLDFDEDGRVTYVDMVNAQRKFNRTLAVKRQEARLHPKLPKKDTFLSFGDWTTKM